MKQLYMLFFLSASILSLDNYVSAMAPTDTLREAKYSLSSRNAEAQSGKYKKIELQLAFDTKSKVYSLDINSEREISAYLEITDQDENIIYFKQLEIKPGSNKLSFVAEDGNQSLFRLSFSEPYATKPAIFIIREELAEIPVQAEVLR